MGILLLQNFLRVENMAEEQNVQAEQPAVDQQADNLAAEALKEAPQTEQPTGEQQQEAAPPQKPGVDEILRDELGKFKGGFADTFGRKTIEMEQRIIEKVDATLKPIRERFDQEEEARIGQLLPEEQVEYYKQKAEQVSSVAQPNQTAQQSQLDPREEAKLQLLADEVQSRISQAGMNIRLDDSRLWTGPNPENNWSQNMSVSEAVKVVERNLNRLQPQNTVPQQQSQNNTIPPAPTTQGAPQKTAKTIRTLSEAATLFADGSINSNQYRELKSQMAKGGSATL